MQALKRREQEVNNIMDNYSINFNLDYPDVGQAVWFFAGMNANQEWEYSYELDFNQDETSEGMNVIIAQGIINPSEYDLNSENEELEIKRFCDENRPEIPQEILREYEMNASLREILRASNTDCFAAACIDYDKSNGTRFYEESFNDLFTWGRANGYALYCNSNTDYVRETLIRTSSDALRKMIPSSITFTDCVKALLDGNVYSALGVGDSLIREELFNQLCKRKYVFDDLGLNATMDDAGDVDYDYIYYLWLDYAERS